MSKASESSRNINLKKIAELLAQLPPEFLLTAANTKDRHEHFFHLREFYKNLHNCWKALHSGKDDPLVPLLKSGEINKAQHDYTWLTVDCYERLWELVQISFRYVRPELERLRMGQVPKFAYELFELIIFNFAKEQFEVCLQDYVKLPGRKLHELQELGLKVYKEEKLSPYEVTRVQKLLAKDWQQEALLVNPEYVVTMDTCYKRANRRQSILKARLDAFNTAMFNLREQEKRLHWHTGSYVWSKGKLIKSEIGGKYVDFDS